MSFSLTYALSPACVCIADQKFVLLPWMARVCELARGGQVDGCCMPQQRTGVWLKHAACSSSGHGNSSTAGAFCARLQQRDPAATRCISRQDALSALAPADPRLLLSTDILSNCLLLLISLSASKVSSRSRHRIANEVTSVQRLFACAVTVRLCVCVYCLVNTRAESMRIPSHESLPDPQGHCDCVSCRFLPINSFRSS